MNRLLRLQYFVPVLLLLALTNSGRCQDDDVAEPTRAARLTYVQGDVTVTQPGQAESIPAQVNLPLLTGVLLSTADDGQAEVEFEDGSVVRLTPNSALEFERLTADEDGVANSHLRLVHGVAFMEVRVSMKYRYVFKTGEYEVRPSENSIIRVDFDEPPPVFSAIAGSIRIDGPQGLRAEVSEGENLRPDADDPGQYHRNYGIVEDSWNQWNDDMDATAAEQAKSSTSVRNDYAGQQGYGWSDLDANGTWYDTDNGPIWQPYAAEATGFDPYGNGAWIGYASVGYLWASAYPWGWTPYRCGNWSYYHTFGWGWSPGSTCGHIGWRFQRGGRPVNIARGPESYRPIRVPSPGHGVQRPIRVGSAVVPAAPRHDERHRPRQIEGLSANPMPTVQNGWRSGGFSALHRDFPVDGRTRQPISGVEANRPVVIHSAPVRPPVPAGTARPAAPLSPSAGRPVYGVQHRRGVADVPASTTPPSVITGGRESRPGGSTTPTRPQTYTPGTPGTTPQHPVYIPPAAIITDGGGRQSRRDGPTTSAPPQIRPPRNPGAPPQNPVYMPPPAVITGGQTHPTHTPPPGAAAPPQHPTYTPPPAVVRPNPTYTPPPAVVRPNPAYTPPPAVVRPHPTYSPPPPPGAAPRSIAPPSSPAGQPAPGIPSGGRR